MAEVKIAGQGRKRPQYDILTDNLLLDPLNPRLPNEVKGKNQDQLLAVLKRDFDLEELAYSISENGYFDEEPLVAIPVDLPKKFAKKSYDELLIDEDYADFINHSDTKFYVAEGNRRLSTIKILLSAKLRTALRAKWPELSEAVEYDISILPVIVYPTRKEVLPYLGVRHITGVVRWEPYAKAVYIADMIKQDYDIDTIQRIIGDRANNAKKTYLSYRIVEQAQDMLDLDTDDAKGSFSLLTLAIGQANVKAYIGLPTQLDKTNFEQPVPTEKIENLRRLFKWLFGNEEEPAALKDSRDITNFLSPVLANEESTDYLVDTGDLREAYERSDGEEMSLVKKLRAAKSALQKSAALISTHQSDAIRKLVDECAKSLKSIQKIISK